MKNDKFWITWHIIIYSASIVVTILFFIPFWLSMLFVNLPDIIDWFILRPIRNRKIRKNPTSNLKNLYSLHQVSDWIRKKFLFWLPDLMYKRYGVITEIITIGILSFLIYLFI